MELDDLKESWKTLRVVKANTGSEHDLAEKISAMRVSGNGIRKLFWIEIAIVVLIYVCFAVMVWLVEGKVFPFLYKIVGVVTLASVPIIWRLYKSQKWISRMDYSMDMRSNMISFLEYFSKSLSIYKWSSYLSVVISLVLIFIDRSFVELSLPIKSIVVIYLLSFMLVTAPYIRATYGAKVKAIEMFLRD